MLDGAPGTLTLLVAHRRDRTGPLTDRLVELIEGGNPGYREAGVVPRADLWRSCHDNIARVLELLADAVEHGEVVDQRLDAAAYDASRETGRRRAEQGQPLDDVLRSFRLGGRLIWEDLVDYARDALDGGGLLEIGTLLWEVVDETSAAVAAAYHQHERRLVRDDEQHRAELWEGVLTGRAHDPGFARDAALLLDLPVNADLLVVVGRGLDPQQADRALVPHATAWVRRSGGVVGLVVLRDRRPDETLAALATLADTVALPVGCSGVVHGLASADEGFRQAGLALRAQGRTPGLAAHDQRLPEMLLLASPDVAARLVARWVAPLLALPGHETRAALDTLTAWVATGGSTTATAAAVHCHRNTVVNRLRRIEEVAGVQLGDGVAPVELDLALRAWRMRADRRGATARRQEPKTDPEG